MAAGRDSGKEVSSACQEAFRRRWGCQWVNGSVNVEHQTHVPFIPSKSQVCKSVQTLESQGRDPYSHLDSF